MAYNYPPTDPYALIQRITEDAYCILEMQAEAQEQNEEAELYLAGLALIGKAWDVRQETEALLKALADFAGDPNMAKPEADATVQMDECILTELWGLFDTAVRLEDQAEREQIRQLAQEVAEFHGLDMRVRDL